MRPSGRTKDAERIGGAPLARTSSSRPHRASCTTPPRARAWVDRVSLGRSARSTRATSKPWRASSIAVAAPATSGADDDDVVRVVGVVSVAWRHHPPSRRLHAWRGAGERVERWAIAAATRRAATARRALGSEAPELFEPQRRGAFGLGHLEVDDGDEAPLAVAGRVGEPLGDDPAVGLLDERRSGAAERASASMPMASYSAQYGAIASARRSALQPLRSASARVERVASSSTQPNAAVRTAVRHAAGGQRPRAAGRLGRQVVVRPARRRGSVHSSSSVASVARISSPSHSTTSSSAGV